MAEVLQKLSVKRFSATSCNRLGTPGERPQWSERYLYPIRRFMVADQRGDG